ncbi:MAG: PrgI family protein [Patescibacteria group bacterium]
MQFQVPQFIEAEDRIIGPLSLRQFGYLCLAGVFSAILYFTVNIVAWVLFSIVLVSIALVVGFVKIQGQDMIRIGTAYVRYFWRPQHYVWQREGQKNTDKDSELKVLAPQGSPLEKIILGMALKQTWRDLQTSEKKEALKKSPEGASQETIKKEQYKIFRKLSGERQAARRIDYR